MKLLSWLNDPIETPLDPAPVLHERLEDLKQIPVTKIMVPRPLVMALDADVQLRRVKRLKSSKFRYFPVYKGDLDHILGWIEKKKVLEILNEGREDNRLENHLQPIAGIRDTAQAADLADVFLKGKSPIVMVLNNQRQCVGLVTLKDFVELLFGFNVEAPLAMTQDYPPAPKPYEI